METLKADGVGSNQGANFFTQSMLNKLALPQAAWLNIF